MQTFLANLFSKRLESDRKSSNLTCPADAGRRNDYLLVVLFYVL